MNEIMNKADGVSVKEVMAIIDMVKAMDEAYHTLSSDTQLDIKNYGELDIDLEISIEERYYDKDGEYRVPPIQIDVFKNDAWLGYIDEIGFNGGIRYSLQEALEEMNNGEQIYLFKDDGKKMKKMDITLREQVSVQRQLSREEVEQGYDKGLIEIAVAGEYSGCDGVVARIDGNEFYFDGMLDYDTVKEYKALHSREEIIDKLKDGLDGLREIDCDEHDLYCLIVREGLAAEKEKSNKKKVDIERD